MNQSAGSAPLIVFEGIDGSGKGTQATRLHQRVSATGISTQLISFPRYQATFFGERIGEFLNGEFGSLDQLDPFLISLLYAGDRFESRNVLAEAMETSQLVVLDRYVASNIAHQSARLNGSRRQRLQDWIQHIEFEIYRLPRPGLTVLLDLPTDVSQQLIRQKQQRTYTEKQTDIQEADVEYLSRVREVYLELADQIPGWKVISVMRDDRIRTVEDISEEIWETVGPILQRAANIAP